MEHGALPSRSVCLQVVDPRDGSTGPALEGLVGERAIVVVVVPQLGDFDSAEYGEQVRDRCPLLQDQVPQLVPQLFHPSDHSAHCDVTTR